MKKLFVGAVVAFIIILIGSGNRSDPMQEEIAGKILRFHILANSDSKEDQELKLKVRDAVGAYVESLLEDSGSREQTEAIINDNMAAILGIADEVIAENGFDYSASGMITDASFPVKSYGKYTFPEGTYRALQIKLGKADGHNWWCVLYPNMCFSGALYAYDSVNANNEAYANDDANTNGNENLRHDSEDVHYDEPTDEADSKLREILTAEEYRDVIESGDFQIHFKFLEYLPFTR